MASGAALLSFALAVQHGVRVSSCVLKCWADEWATAELEASKAPDPMVSGHDWDGRVEREDLKSFAGCSNPVCLHGGLMAFERFHSGSVVR